MNKKQARKAALEIVQAMIWSELKSPSGYTSGDGGMYSELANGDTLDDQVKIHHEMEVIADELLRKLDRLNQR